MNSSKTRALTLVLSLLLAGCGRPQHYAEVHTSNGKIQVQLCDDTWRFSLEHPFGSSDHRLYQWTTLYGPGPIVAVSIGTYLVNQNWMDAKFSAESGRHAHELAALRIENDRLRKEVERLSVTPVPPAPVTPVAAAMTTAAMAAPPQADVVMQQRRVILQNLRELAKAREQFILENGRPPASLADLDGPTNYVWRLDPVAGEDYSKLVFGDGQTFSVTTANGVTVTMVTSSLDAQHRVIPGTTCGMTSAPSPELLDAITKAIDAFRQAHEGGNPLPQDFEKLLPFFRTPIEAADYVDWLQNTAAL